VTDPTPEVALEADVEPAGKGRPTPKRAAARKARRNVTPKNRKEAAAIQRERSRNERRVARTALLTGDERHLPARDAGPAKRLARDVIDSRFTLGQVLFGLIFVSFAASLALANAHSTLLRTVANAGPLLFLAVMAYDGGRNGRRARKAVEAKYGAAESRGIAAYAFMRALLPRRFRRPPPKVSRGDQIG
jgi:hypothetical protein